MDDDRSALLLPLLISSRYCLASSGCLKKLYRHVVVQNNRKVREVIVEALSYLADYRHGYYSSPAWPRKGSEFLHVGIKANRSRLKALFLEESTWYDLPCCSSLTYIRALTVFDGELYILSGYQNHFSKVMVFRNMVWHSVVTLPGENIFLLSHQSHIYAFDHENSAVNRFNPKHQSLTLSQLTWPFGSNLTQHAIGLDSEIVVFCQSDITDMTAVYEIDVAGNIWTRHADIQGSAHSMISFRSGESHYIFQCEGNLLEMVKKPREGLVFTVAKRELPIKRRLNGCVMYMDTLYLCSGLESSEYSSVPGVFSHVHFWHHESTSSNFVHYILLKKNLRKSRETETLLH